MKNIPKRIYLQIDPENEKPEDFKELGEVTWCEDRINKSDIEYTRNSKCKEYREALEFYMRYSNDSRNLGIITTKIEKALKS